MKVHELMQFLQQCDPDALVVAHLAYRGIEEITSVERKDLGGLGHRMSFEKVPVVELDSGDAQHMKSQGLDVLGTPRRSPHVEE